MINCYFTDGSINAAVTGYGTLGCAGYLELNCSKKLNIKDYEVKTVFVDTSDISMAEAVGVHLAIDKIEKGSKKDLNIIYTDSQTVVNFIKGKSRLTELDTPFKKEMDLILNRLSETNHDIVFKKIRSHVKARDQRLQYPRNNKDENGNREELSIEEASFINKGNRIIDKCVNGGCYTEKNKYVPVPFSYKNT